MTILLLFNVLFNIKKWSKSCKSLKSEKRNTTIKHDDWMTNKLTHGVAKPKKKGLGCHQSFDAFWEAVKTKRKNNCIHINSVLKNQLY